MIKHALWAALALSLLLSANAFAGAWGYDGQADVYTPEHWEHVSAICGEGHSQSPIDIETADVVDGTIDMEIKYNGGEAELVNNGHAVTAYNDRYIVIDGVRYDLVQFHFHTLSEHTVNGEHYDMEMHFVHADAT